jgi:integrase
MISKLTNTIVEKIPLKEKRYDIRDAVLHALILRVEPSGKKSWLVDYTRPNGRRNTRKLGNADVLTVAQAREAAREYLASVTLGTDPGERGNSTVSSLEDLLSTHYAEWAHENRKSGEYTLRTIRSSFRNMLDRHPDGFSLLEFEKWRLAERRRGVKAATINRKTMALRGVLSWGVKQGLLETNALSQMSRLQERDSETKVRYLSDYERRRLMDALDDREEKIRAARDRANEWRAIRELPLYPDLRRFAFVDHLKPAVLVSMNTGIRRGALFALEWRDVDFNEKTITLKAENAKTGKHQIVPMNQVVMETLLKWRAQANEREKCVFEVTDCHKGWGQVLKKAGIENFRWHDLRHDFASRLVMAGVDLNTVRELLGHGDLKMTLRYAHLAPEKKRKAVDLLK